MEQSPAELKLLHCSSWKTNGSEPESPSMQSAMVLSGQGMELMSEESQNQLRWDRAMCNELGLPQGYGKVSVLLVKWNNEEDQFKQTEEEVKKLKSVFQNSFNYHTKVVDLSGRCACLVRCGCTPQTRLDRSVESFMKKNDRPNNLTIIYYTGHGSYQRSSESDAGYLKLHAWDEKPNSPWLIWDHAEERFIQNAKGDVLTIMDACFAGAVRSVVQREYGRTYEYLGACAADKPTASPGEKSFTAALITSLELLLEEGDGRPFTTADLSRAIEEQHYRKHNPPCLIIRSAHDDRRIMLAPMRADSQEPYFDDSEIPAYLELRIELKEQLTPQEVEDLARVVSRAVHNSTTKTRRVDWLRMSSRKPSFKSAANLVYFANLIRNRKKTLNTIPEDVLPVPIKRPGLFATFGFMDWNLVPHIATFTLLKPWTRFVGSAVVVAGLALLYFRRVYQTPEGMLRSFFG